MTSLANVSTPRLDRVLDVLMVVSIFFFGTFDTWITTGEAGEPIFLLSVLLVAVGLTLWLVASFIDTRPEPAVRTWHIRKPYMAEAFFWAYFFFMWGIGVFGIVIIDTPSGLVAVSSLVMAMALARFLYARGFAVW
jgi:hypothetical protein